MDLDQIDINILSLLQREGRIRNAALAEAVHLSQSACLARVKRLETAGYIRGYAALLDLGRLGETVTVFASIKLDDQGKDRQKRTEAKLRGLPEVVECHVVSGEYDYLARFVCRDIARYHAVTNALLADTSLGIRGIDSRFVMQALKPFAGIDLKTLAVKKS